MPRRRGPVAYRHHGNGGVSVACVLAAAVERGGCGRMRHIARRGNAFPALNATALPGALRQAASVCTLTSRLEVLDGRERLAVSSGSGVLRPRFTPPTAARCPFFGLVFFAARPLMAAGGGLAETAARRGALSDCLRATPTFTNNVGLALEPHPVALVRFRCGEVFTSTSSTREGETRC